MKFGFDEINYKKTYLRYIWISIIIAIVILVINFGIINIFSDDDGILRNNVAITVTSILYPFLIISIFYLIFSIMTGLPFVIYISIKKMFREGYIEIEDNHVKFIRTCNIVDDSRDYDDRKYKVTKYFNVTKIIEKKWCYKIVGEIDYFYAKTGNLKVYISNEDNRKKIIIKNKKGTFRIPKCFGNQNEFKNEIFNIVNKEQIESESKENTKYKSFTEEGFIDFMINILGTLLVLFGKGIFVLIGITLCGWKGIKAINVLREQNRDRFFSVINILIAIFNFVILVITMNY